MGLNLKLQYRKKLAEVLEASGCFEDIYFKVGIQLDLSKISIKDTNLPTLVVAFAGGTINSLALNQDLQAGYNDQNMIYFYIIAKDNYLNNTRNDDYNVITEKVENGQRDLIKTISEATKFRGTASQFEFDFTGYEYVQGDESDNNYTIIVQFAEHKIEIYS